MTKKEARSKLPKPLLMVLVLLLGLVGVAVGCAYYGQRDAQLSEAPERGGVTASLPDQPSRLQIALEIPFVTLERAANQALPGTMKISGHGKKACVGPICAGTKYKATIKRKGAFALHRHGDDLVARLILEIRGNGGLRDDGAKLIKVDKKNFRSKVRLDARLKLALDDSWCPSVDADMRYEWLEKPKVEIVHKVWVNVENQVGKAVDKALKDLEKQIESAVQCEPVQQAVREAWAARSLPIELDGETLYANLTPQSLGSTGMLVADDHVKLVVSAVAKTEVSTRAFEVDPRTDLPPNTPPAGDAPSRLDLALTLRAEYERIEDALTRALVDEPLILPSDAGDVVVTPRAVTVYPSMERLAVGLEFDADLPSRFFDVGGQVFVSAQPVVSESGLALRLADVEFARRLDHDLWNVLTAVFEARIVQQIEALGTVDFEPLWNDSEARLREQLAEGLNGSGLEVELGEGTARLSSLVPEEDQLAAVVELGFPVNATVRELKLSAL